MAATYFVVINKQAYPSDAKAGEKVSAKSGCEAVQPGISSAKVVKIISEAGTVAQAQEIARELYPAECTGTPVVVAEAAWKES